MTPEIIAIVTVGVALAGVILTSARGVRQDINELRGEVGTLRERMAHLTGSTRATVGASRGHPTSRVRSAVLCPGRGGLIQRIRSPTIPVQFKPWHGQTWDVL